MTSQVARIDEHDYSSASKLQFLQQSGGIAMAKALQEIAAKAKTMPAPKRTEMAPGRFQQQLHNVHATLPCAHRSSEKISAVKACKEIPCEVAPEEGTQKHSLHPFIKCKKEHKKELVHLGRQGDESHHYQYEKKK